MDVRSLEKRLPAVAANVKNLRLARAYSQESLALAAGIPPELVASVESCEAAPSIKLIWSLATALRVPFGSLLAEPREAVPGPKPARPAEPAASARNPSCRALLPVSRHGRGTQLYELTIAPGTSSITPARTPGGTESLLVTQGRVELIVGGKQHVLARGESLELGADLPRRYRNTGEGTAKVYIVSTEAAAQRSRPRTRRRVREQ